MASTLQEGPASHPPGFDPVRMARDHAEGGLRALELVKPEGNAEVNHQRMRQAATSFRSAVQDLDPEGVTEPRRAPAIVTADAPGALDLLRAAFLAGAEWAATPNVGDPGEASEEHDAFAHFLRTLRSSTPGGAS